VGAKRPGAPVSQHEDDLTPLKADLFRRLRPANPGMPSLYRRTGPRNAEGRTARPDYLPAYSFSMANCGSISTGIPSSFESEAFTSSPIVPYFSMNFFAPS